MNLLESLKAAKQHLLRSQGARGYKSGFICFAIYDAYYEKYGEAAHKTQVASTATRAWCTCNSNL